MCASWCLGFLPSLNTPDAVACVPVLASATLRDFFSSVKTSSSSMHGSAELVAVIVKRTNFASTG